MLKGTTLAVKASEQDQKEGEFKAMKINVVSLTGQLRSMNIQHLTSRAGLVSGVNIIG